jgi:hypothetical protein
MSKMVCQLIDEMENRLNEAELPDSDFFAAWNEKFHAAVEGAEKGPDWESIVTRAHSLSKTIQNMVEGLNYERDRIREEIILQQSGKRALNGYSLGDH